MTDLNPALVKIGSALRERRDALGLTALELHQKTAISQSKISKIETGKYAHLAVEDLDRVIQALAFSNDAREALLDLFEVAGLPASSMELIDLAGIDKKQLQIQQLEAGAQTIRHFSSHIIPGLLQLPEYSQHVFRQLGLQEEAIPSAVEARQRRQKILVERARQFHFVLTESSLYSAPGPPRVQGEQLSWLLMLGTRPNIRVGVVPFRAPMVIDASHGFTIYDDFLVGAETMAHHMQLRRRNEIERFAKTFADLARVSLPSDDTTRCIERAIEWFTRQSPDESEPT